LFHFSPDYWAAGAIFLLSEAFRNDLFRFSLPPAFLQDSVFFACHSQEEEEEEEDVIRPSNFEGTACIVLNPPSNSK